MPEPAAPAHRWHQTLPAWVGIIATVLIQTVVISMYLGSLRSDIDATMTVNAQQQAAIERTQAETQRMQVENGRVGERLQAMQDGLNELKAGQRELLVELRRILEERK